MKNIVVYASRTGTTEKMAKEVAKHLGAELMKVDLRKVRIRSHPCRQRESAE